MLNRVEEIDHTDLDNHDRLRAVMQKEGIKQNEFGGRMHYLRWEHPTTLQAWNDAGMTYTTQRLAMPTCQAFVAALVLNTLHLIQSPSSY